MTDNVCVAVVTAIVEPMEFPQVHSKKLVQFCCVHPHTRPVHYACFHTDIFVGRGWDCRWL